MNGGHLINLHWSIVVEIVNAYCVNQFIWITTIKGSHPHKHSTMSQSQWNICVDATTQTFHYVTVTVCYRYHFIIH